MPREGRFRRSAAAAAMHSPARRRLFDEEIDREELSQRLQTQLDQEVNEQSRRWGFNFQTGIPLSCSSGDNNNNPPSSSTTTTTTTSETFIYETLNANEVPLLYRSHEILRKEIPGVGVVEIKHYPNGRGPIQNPPSTNIGTVEPSGNEIIQTPTKPAAVEEEVVKPVENKRKRHLPTPSTTPMKLRKRTSPHKTPVNPGRHRDNEHHPTSSNAAAGINKQRPRRNLIEKFTNASSVSAATTTTVCSNSTSLKDGSSCN